MCELCDYDKKEAIYATDAFFVIDARHPDYPGYVRIVASEHRKEMTDFEDQTRFAIYEAMAIVEKVMRRTMRPDKVNWAQFGNMVPHLHWHAIPRYADDTHFPNSIWGSAMRTTDTKKLEERRVAAENFKREVALELRARFG